ncbi:MAG: PEGA domain-containing protein [Patescibacteria group bacterium]
MIVLKRTAMGILVWAIIGVITLLIIMFARGYRFNLDSKSVKSRGILVANSLPNSSQIYINDKFSSLTPDNIYLAPGEYSVRLQKEGYIPWEKHYSINAEVVSRTDALLFSTNPSLSPLTRQGVINPLLSPSRESIVYLSLPDESDVQSQENGGIFMAKISSKTLSFFRQRSILVPYSKLPFGFVPEKTKFIFSPDEKNILVFLYDDTDALTAALLISTGNPGAGFLDATISYESLIENWETQQTEIQQQIFDTLGKKVRMIFENNTYLIDISPAKNKLLYFAMKPAILPYTINPPLIGSVPTAQSRTLKSGEYYVYDIKEDKNYVIDIYSSPERLKTLSTLEKVLENKEVSVANWLDRYLAFSNIFWYSDSRHVVYMNGESINIVEYDSQNNTLIYSGPFETTFSAVSSDGDLIVLTNINPKKNKLPNLYTVSIK